MKKSKFTSLIVILLLSGSIFASIPTNKKLLKNSPAKIENNLLNGLYSNNNGLQISSTYFLGEMKSEKALIPLMNLLRSGKTEGAKAMAALSLIKIGNQRGIYMVMQGAKFNDSKKIRKLCKHLYKSYLFENFYNNFSSTNGLVITEVSN